ncbi:hypothetical protein R6Q59_004662 [Mikania micrantha]
MDEGPRILMSSTVFKLVEPALVTITNDHYDASIDSSYKNDNADRVIPSSSSVSKTKVKEYEVFYKLRPKRCIKEYEDAIAMQNFGRRYAMPPQYNYVKSSKHDISQSNSVVGMFLTGTFTSYDNMNDGEDSKSIAQKLFFLLDQLFLRTFLFFLLMCLELEGLLRFSSRLDQSLTAPLEDQMKASENKDIGFPDSL